MAVNDRLVSTTDPDAANWEHEKVGTPRCGVLAPPKLDQT